ncbi:MAG: hypothetical protein ABIC82_05365 [bacterium]
MSKKFFGFLALMILFFSLSTTRVAMSGAMPEAGDAVYRDIDSSIASIKLVGHAGICIGNFEVIHMQSPRIEKTALTNFYVDYWGSFYAGYSSTAKKRVDEAKKLLEKKAKYNFFDYKSFGASFPFQSRGRCDGFVEWCFENAGNQVANDNGWTTLSPQLQWKSKKTTTRYCTTRGKTAYTSALIGVDSKLEKLL